MSLLNRRARIPPRQSNDPRSILEAAQVVGLHGVLSTTRAGVAPTMPELGIPSALANTPRIRTLANGIPLIGVEGARTQLISQTLTSWSVLGFNGGSPPVNTATGETRWGHNVYQIAFPATAAGQVSTTNSGFSTGGSLAAANLWVRCTSKAAAVIVVRWDGNDGAAWSSQEIISITDQWKRFSFVTARTGVTSFAIRLLPDVGSDLGPLTIEVAPVTVEAATFPTSPILGQNTRNADTLIWTPPSPLSTTSRTIMILGVPLYWDAATSISSLIGLYRSQLPDTGFIVTFFDTSSDRFSANPEVAGTLTVTGSGAAVGKLRPFTLAETVDGVNLTLSVNGGAYTASKGLPAPYTAVSSLYIGDMTSSRYFQGAVSVLYWTPALTATQIAAVDAELRKLV